MTARAVVINAGPLMVLAKLNLLHLLNQVYFAEAVYHEVVTEGMRQGLIGMAGVLTAPVGMVEQCRDRPSSANLAPTAVVVDARYPPE